jgi:hypothetical protein
MFIQGCQAEGERVPASLSLSPMFSHCRRAYSLTKTDCLCAERSTTCGRLCSIATCTLTYKFQMINPPKEIAPEA